MGRSGSGLASSLPLGTPTSSVDSSSDPPSVLDTNLSLGLRGFLAYSSSSSSSSSSISSSTTCPAGSIQIPVIESIGTKKRYDWPPRTITGRSYEVGERGPCLFIKVYMEGDLIGRKLDLLAHDGYGKLITFLARMFQANIQSEDVMTIRLFFIIPRFHIGRVAGPAGTMTVHHPNEFHILKYKDKDGDWLMVGDVPWE
ncbi:hypothetical protein MLD38_010749 [Melastoma candidum]|uniref:Uncharacterized protein n=1 Tax=Melastoma candidum TaxID=119954 RepID=A0ACB9R3Y2_9MYRT|nr:hypothetical protein MLD38_010749 [Melastoma candidum]